MTGAVILDRPSRAELLAHLHGLGTVTLAWSGEAATLTRDSGAQAETRQLAREASERIFAKAHARPDPIWLSAWWYAASVDPGLVEHSTSARRLLN